MLIEYNAKIEVRSPINNNTVKTLQFEVEKISTGVLIRPTGNPVLIRAEYDLITEIIRAIDYMDEIGLKNHVSREIPNIFYPNDYFHYYVLTLEKVHEEGVTAEDTLINEAITEIITDFEALEAGYKQYFDIRKTDAWKRLRTAKLLDNTRVKRLEKIIDKLADANMELYDEFGDKF